MLEEKGQPFTYREYRDEPLSVEELRRVLALLGMGAGELLRPKESKALGISADMPEDEILAAMAKEPTLVQRPICIDGERAILARPADKLIDFLAN